MAIDETALQTLIDKDAIRDLVLVYARAADRKDVALRRDLYTEDATDTHGTSFDGTAEAYCDYIEQVEPHITFSAHNICNHLISVDGDTGSGEVYAVTVVCYADQNDPTRIIADLVAVRYLDNYRRCADGKWRFSKRVVLHDMHLNGPFDGDGLLGSSPLDPSYKVCDHALFQRGARV